VELQRGAARLVLEEVPEAGAGGAPVLALRLPGDELAATLRRLAEAGVEVHGGVANGGAAEGGATVVDPAGHRLRLVAADGRAMTGEAAGRAPAAAEPEAATAPPPAP
jgi:hypothetical protein